MPIAVFNYLINYYILGELFTCIIIHFCKLGVDRIVYCTYFYILFVSSILKEPFFIIIHPDLIVIPFTVSG